MGSTDTWSTMLDGLVADRELCKIMTGHLWLDFDAVEHLSIVDANDAADHLWDNDHISQVGLDNSRLLVWWSSLFGSTKLFNETHRTSLKTALEATTGAAMYEIYKLQIINLKNPIIS